MNYKEQLSAFKSEKRKEIVEKAYWLFLEKGIDQVTLEDVAKASNVSPITIYRYFGDKKTLLIECGELFWEETYQLNNPSKSTQYANMTGYEQVSALISAFIPAVLKYPQHLRFLQRFDSYMLQTEVKKEELKDYDAAISGWNEMCYNAFQKGNEDHTIREGLDFTTVYLTTSHMLMSFGQKLASSALLPSDEILSNEKQIRFAIDIILNYIRPEEK